MQNTTSLVKYNSPILVNTISASKSSKKGQKKVNVERQTTQTEDILNSILPPRYNSSHKIDLDKTHLIKLKM
jgi:hypothetical protein